MFNIPMGSIVLQLINSSAQRLLRQGRVAVRVYTHQFWHSSSLVEIKFIPCQDIGSELFYLKNRN